MHPAKLAAIITVAAAAIFAGGIGVANLGTSTVSNSVFIDFQKFVSDSQQAAYYSKWTSQNPGELSRWSSFRDAILNGQNPTTPVMTTKYGAALVDAGVEYLDSTGTSSTTTSTSNGTTTTASTTTTTAAGCTTTVSSLSAAQSAVDNASGGSTICLTQGAYGQLILNSSHGSNVTLIGALGSSLTGIVVSGNYITISNFKINGGVFLNYPAHHVTISYNDISNPTGFGLGIDGGLGANPVPQQPGVHDITATHNKIHNDCQSGAISNCEGDAFHISGWGKINFTYNEVYGIKQNSTPGALHTDVLQSYQAGDTSGANLVYDHNYAHDNDCEGFFIKDGPVTNITYTQNLGLRNPSEGHPLDVYDTTNFVINHNTDWASSLAVLEGSGTLSFDHNVWDDFENAGSWSVTKSNNIYGSQPFTSPFSTLSSGESVNGNPGFVNPTTDDYRLVSNSGLGIDWRPSDQVYGPK